MKPLDMREQVNAICALIDVDPALVRKIEIEPSVLVAEVYEKNEKGVVFAEKGDRLMRHVVRVIRT